MSDPVLIIGRFEIPDMRAYAERYGKPVIAGLGRFGGELVAATPKSEVLEGEWPGNWTVVIRFPDREAAEKWYDSTEYDTYKEIRTAELGVTGDFVVVPGRSND